MPNVMAALLNTGGALCSTPQFGYALTLPRRETCSYLLGCPKLMKRCLSCEDIAQQSCAMGRRCRFFASFLRPVFPASRVQHISDLQSKFALEPHHVWKYGRHPICGR